MVEVYKRCKETQNTNKRWFKRAKQDDQVMNSDAVLSTLGKSEDPKGLRDHGGSSTGTRDCWPLRRLLA